MESHVQWYNYNRNKHVYSQMQNTNLVSRRKVDQIWIQNHEKISSAAVRCFGLIH